jgi:hypothetical protein
MFNTLIIEAAATGTQNIGTSVSLWVTLIIPLIFLVLWSMIKYIVAIARKQIEWIQMLAEMPIDFLLIWATLLMSKYFVHQQDIMVIIIAFALILFSLVLAVFLCIYRQYILEKAGSIANPDWDKVRNHLLYLWIGVIVWLIIILIVPSWNCLKSI